MIMILSVITPLQGANFGRGPIQLREPATFYTSQDVMPLRDQWSAIDGSIPYLQNAIKYFDQPYPPFTTAEYALRPFDRGEASLTPGSTNWTATTTMFWSDVSCQPAQDIKPFSENIQGTFDFHDGKGCNISIFLWVPRVKSDKGTSYQLEYFSWHSSMEKSITRANETCLRQSPHTFVAVMTRRNATKLYLDTAEMKAVFCDATYWKQCVSVTVPDNSFHSGNTSITPLESAVELPATEVNITGFELLLDGNVMFLQDRQGDDSSRGQVNQYDRVNGTGAECSLGTIEGLAIGGLERLIEEYFDEFVMEEIYSAIHRSLFALTYKSLLTEETASNETTDGSVDYVMYGVVVSRVFSAIIERLLLIVGTSCILLLHLASRMKSNLSTDPAALSDQISIL